MTQNIGTIDRIARVVVGIAVLTIFLLPIGTERWIASIGLAPLFSALVGWCPLYAALGINTIDIRGMRQNR